MWEKLENLYELHQHISGALGAKDLFNLIIEQQLHEKESDKLDEEFKKRFGVENFSELIKNSPKEAEKTLYEKFCKFEDTILTDTNEFRNKITARYGFSFYVTSNPKIRRKISKQICETFYEQGIKYLELRVVSFKPGTTSEDTAWDQLSESVYGMIDAKDNLPDFDFSYIIGVARHHFVDKDNKPDESKIKHAENILRFLVKKLEKNDDIAQYVLGIDATDKEVLPPRYLKNIFEIAIESGLIPVPHAGENFKSIEEGIQNIYEHIDILEAKRIGHALAACVDPRKYLGKNDEYGKLYTKSRVEKIIELQDNLIKYMKERSIVVETCPTSNIITLGLKSYEEHPIRRFLDSGVNVVICSDSSGIYGITLKDEIKNVAVAQNFSLAELEKVLENSRKYSLKNLVS
jgi:adenosine deaminase